jgi:glyoxylase-like metal-dependent hydrolase (beta-lactamase superfamily II)
MALEFKYSQNWNGKLLLNSYFTTIRIYNPAYHTPGVLAQNKYNRKQNDVIEFTTEIVNVMPIMLDSIPDFVFFIDTGYPKKESIEMFEKMYKSKPIDVHKVQFAIITHKHRPDVDNKISLITN